MLPSGSAFHIFIVHPPGVLIAGGFNHRIENGSCSQRSRGDVDWKGMVVSTARKHELHPGALWILTRPVQNGRMTA